MEEIRCSAMVFLRIKHAKIITLYHARKNTVESMKTVIQEESERENGCKMYPSAADGTSPHHYEYNGRKFQIL